MPIVLQEKIFLKEPCALNVKWGDLLSTGFVVKNNNFIEDLRKLSAVSVPRYLFIDQHNVTVLEFQRCIHTSIFDNHIIYDDQKITIFV